MNQKHSTPMPGTPAGGVDLNKGMLLGGEGLPPDQIDLSKPIDEQTFRKAVLSILSGGVDALISIAHDMQRGFPMIANSAVDLADSAKALNAKLDAFAVVDTEDLPDTVPAAQEGTDAPDDAPQA